jgi:hypothetical protein
VRAKTLLLTIVVLTLAAYPTFAGSIVDIGLFDTGTVSTGTDPHYTILGGGAASVVVPVPAPPWVANSSDSRWISDRTNVYGVTTTVDVNYTYWTTFDLSNYVLSSVVITGNWAVDDFGAIHLNGSATPLAGTVIAFDAGGSQYSGMHSFTINTASGLVQGINMLAFGVNNKGQPGDFNPSGLRVEFTGFQGTLSGIPEPGSMVLMGGGLLALGVFLRRRQVR